MFPSRWIDQIVRRTRTSPRGRTNPFQFRPKLELLEERENPSNVLVNSLTMFGQINPDIARDLIGDSVVVWQSNTPDRSGYSIEAQRFDHGGNPVQGEFRVNTTPLNAQTKPVVAMDSQGDFVVVWQSANNNGDLDVLAQRYGSTGAKLGGEFTVNQITAGDQSEPSVAMDAQGDFVVAWQTRDATGRSSIEARKFTMSGAVSHPTLLAGNEVRVNASTTEEDTPSVAIDGSGKFVVAWAGFTSGLTSFDIVARRFDANANPLGGEFTVNTFTASAQINPSVASDAAGDFVVAWQSLFQDGSGWGVYGQRFDSSGKPTSTEFRVNQFTAGDQITPVVTMDIRGNFVVAWDSVGQDGDADGIYARGYAADGSTLIPEYLVNTVTAGAQKDPAVALDGSGVFTVTWDSPGVDGSQEGIVADTRVLLPNKPPVAQPIPTVTIQEDSDPVTIDLTQYFSDDFTPNALLSYSLNGNTNSALVTPSLQGGQLTLTIPRLMVGNASITVRVADLSGGVTDAPIHVVVTPVPHPPTALSLSGNSVAEAAPAGTAVGTFSATDADPSNTFTYSLISGTGSDDNSQFRIVGNQLQVLTPPDFEGRPPTRSVRVRVTDMDGKTFESSFTVNVTDDADMPTSLTLTGNSVSENVPLGTMVGTLAATDNDADDLLNLSLVSDGSPNDNALFVIDSANRLVTAGPITDDGGPTKRVVVRVTDAGGQTLTKSFTINVIDVPQPPTNFTGSYTQPLNENAGANYSFFQLSSIDPEGGPVVYSFDNTGGGFPDNALFSINGNTVSAKQSFDFEVRSSYTVQVRATGADGDFTVRTFTFNVTDDPSNPTSLALTGNTVDEQATVGTTVGTISSTDQDADDPVTYSLVSDGSPNDNALFSIANGNQLVTAAAINHEGGDTLTVLLRVTDAGGQTLTKHFTINVTDTDSPPSNFTGTYTRPLYEFSGANYSFFQLSATAAEGGPVTFSFDNSGGGLDNAFFSLTPTGTLSANQSFDFDVQSLYFVQVDATDSEGNSVRSQFAINVTDVFEAPSAVTLDNTSVPQNHQFYTVGNLGSTGLDSGDSATYSLVPGAGDTDNARFRIVGNKLQTNEILHFATNPTDSVRIRSTNSVGLFAEQSFTITVIDNNNPPTFTPGPSLTVSPSTTTNDVNWATNISPGSPAEAAAGQQVHFVIESISNPNLFVANGQPTISPNGTLSFTTASINPNAGPQQAFIQYHLMDDGGTANGGVDSSPSFVESITVDSEQIISRGDPTPVAPSRRASQFNPDAAHDSRGNDIIVWQESSGNGQHIVGRRFDTLGNPLGDAFQIDQNTGTDSLFSAAVAMDANGNFVVTWVDQYIGDITRSTILAQRFDSSGNPVGNEITVARKVSPTELTSPDVALDDRGHFLVTWTDTFTVVNPNNPNGTTASEIHASEFDGNSVPIFQNTLVSSPDQLAADPAVAMDAAGDAVIAWDASVGLGDTNIYARRLDPNGNLAAGSIQVNQIDHGRQITPDVGTDANGNFVVAWDSEFNFSAPVYVRRFDFSGNPLSGDVLVAPDATNPVLPSVSVRPDGTYAVAVTSFPNGSINDYRFQVYRPDGTLFGTTVTASPTYCGANARSAILLSDVRDQIVLAFQSGISGQILQHRYAFSAAPTGINPNGFSISENAAPGTLVGTLVGQDPDPGETFTYSGNFGDSPFSLGGLNGDQIILNSGLDYLQQSSYSFNVTVTDATGLTGTFPVTIMVLPAYDYVGPAIQIGGSSGTVSDDTHPNFTWSITDDTAFTDNVVVTNSSGGTIFNSTDPSGSFDLTTFGPGTYQISITSTDSDGHNESEHRTSTNSATVTVIDPTNGPTIAITGPTGSVSDDTDPAFTWSVTSDHNLQNVTVSLTQGGTVVFTSSQASGGVHLNQYGPGSFTLTIIATDSDSEFEGDVDRSTNSASVQVFDPEGGGPNITITGPRGSVSDDTRPTFSWNVADGGNGVDPNSVSVVLLMRETTVFTSSALSGTVDLLQFGGAPGLYTLKVRASDLDNQFPGDVNTSRQSASVRVFDAEASSPIITINGPSGSVSDDTRPALSWNIADSGSGVDARSVSVVLTRNGTTVFSSNALSGTVDLLQVGGAPGDYQLTVTASDLDNEFPGDVHISTQSAAVTVFDPEASGPIITINGPTESVSDDTRPSLSWNIADSGTGIDTESVSVILKFNGQVVFTSGALSGRVNLLQYGGGPGLYTLTVTASDLDNEFPGDVHTSTRSSSVTVFDPISLPPQAFITLAADTLGGTESFETDDQNQTFFWSVDDQLEGIDHTLVTLRRGGDILFQQSYSGSQRSGSYDFNRLGLGDFLITVTTFDADTEFPGDQQSTTATKTVHVTDPVPPPEVTVTLASETNQQASEVTETDAQDRTFSWRIAPSQSPLASNLTKVERLVPGGSPQLLFSSGSLSDSYTLNYFGLGDFLITVTATDTDNDFPGDVNTTTVNRLIHVIDDPVIPPPIPIRITTAVGEPADEGGASTEAAYQNQVFFFSGADTVPDLDSRVLIEKLNGQGEPQVLLNQDNSGGAFSGSFDFNRYGTGDYLITVTAIDTDNEFEGDAHTTTRTRLVHVTADPAPLLTLDGSQGVQSDAETQQFSWNFESVTPQGATLRSTLFRNGVAVMTSTDLAGSFNFDALGLGFYKLVVSASNSDQFDGSSVTVVDTRSVLVFDDVPTIPVVTVVGSTGMETTDKSHVFAWETSDMSLGANLTATVVVTRDGKPIFTSTDLNGIFDFSGMPTGQYDFSIAVSDQDRDWIGDEGIATATRSVMVVDVVTDPIIPIIPPTPPTPPIQPPTPPPTASLPPVTIQPFYFISVGSLPGDPGGTGTTQTVAEGSVRQPDTVVSIQLAQNVAVLLSTLTIPVTPDSQIGVPGPVADQMAALSADVEEMKSPQARPIGLPSVAVSSVLDGDDSVRLIEQLDRMSRPIQVDVPRPINRGPMQPPSVEVRIEVDSESRPVISSVESNSVTPTPDEQPEVSVVEPPTEIGQTAVQTEKLPEPSAGVSPGWIVAGALALPRVALGCRRWLGKRFGQE